MADVQLEKGFARIANEIFDNIVKIPLNGTQFRIVILLWRETYGFSRKDESTPALIFTAFSIDPAGTLDSFLKFIERQAKIEDQSGSAWKWGYRLTFWHRLSIALKLVIGTKKLKEA
jgi:phage replication O-like protein O